MEKSFKFLDPDKCNDHDHGLLYNTAGYVALTLSCCKMAKHTLKILQCSHCKIFKGALSGLR